MCGRLSKTSLSGQVIMALKAPIHDMRLGTCLGGHRAQALLVFCGLLKGVCSNRLYLRAICGMPVGICLLALGPVGFACAVCGNIEGLNLVHIVVVHAPLSKDVLAPWAELPIAAVVGARAELRIAILQILRQYLHSSVCNNLEVTEKPHLDIGAILVVEPMWRISWLCAQPSPQTLRVEDGISVNLYGIVCRLPFAHLANLEPDLVKDRPIHPSTRILPLQLVEFVIGVLHLDGHIPICVDGRRHIAEDIPLLASEDSSSPRRCKIQQLELMIWRRRIASVLGVHREAVELLPERIGHRHRVGCDDVASESHLAGCASLVALSPPCSLGETLVPGDLAAAGVHAILSSFQAGWHAGLDLNSFLLILHAHKIRGHARTIRGRPPLDCTG